MGGPVGVIRALVSQDVLLRALLSAKMKEELSFAFMLRAKEEGLSVTFDQTPAECQAGFSCTYGVAAVTVQGVSDAGLESGVALHVVPDEPHHANITGMPHKEDDPLRAELVASHLARQATLVSAAKVVNP